MGIPTFELQKKKRSRPTSGFCWVYLASGMAVRRFLVEINNS